MGTPSQNLTLRIDIAQPYIWARSRESLPHCADNQTSSYDDQCESGTGAFAQDNSSTYYNQNDWQRLLFLDYVWVNGTVAQDTITFDNVTFGNNGTQNLTISEIDFIEANDSRIITGALGLSSKLDDDNSHYNTNFLDVLRDNNVINSSSFSLYHESRESADLMLGGINQDYYVGDFVKFDKLPYLDTATDQLQYNYPILPLTSLKVSNSHGQSAYIIDSNDTEPVLIDTRSSYNYLPYSMLVALAVQLNAFYSNDIDVWLLKCSISELNATVGFQFGNVTINVPIEELISPAYTSNSDNGNETLVFDDGEEACLLLITPNYYFGYSVLGSPFFKSAYIAVDNEANQIAVAQAAKPATTRRSLSSNATTTDYAQSAISSGYIPFAVTNNVTGSYTLRFDQSSIKSSVDPDMVTVSITNGEIFTGRVQTTDSSSAMSSSMYAMGNKLSCNRNSIFGYIMTIFTMVGLGVFL